MAFTSSSACTAIALLEVEKIDLEIEVPPSFPGKYRPSLVRAAEFCAVKKHFERPPQVESTTREVVANPQ